MDTYEYAIGRTDVLHARVVRPLKHRARTQPAPSICSRRAKGLAPGSITTPAPGPRVVFPYADAALARLRTRRVDIRPTTTPASAARDARAAHSQPHPSE